jgi:plastocyanin
MRRLLPALVAAVVLVPVGVVHATAAHGHGQLRRVQIPEADRFAPFAITIKVGDTVKWTNGDEDAHAVVAINPFTTAGHRGTDQVIEPDEAFALSFDHPGVFVYYCRFHAQLDAFNQPIAPGPDGGIQSENGNFGTPMAGTVTVVDDD